VQQLFRAKIKSPRHRRKKAPAQNQTSPWLCPLNVWVVVMNPFFARDLPVAYFFFARGFACGSRQNKSLTNKIWADLPAGKKKDSLND
jgi:hypothetical protein